MKHILIVDDNRTIISVVSSILRETYEIATASNGAQALEYLKDNTVDLILLDIIMPVMDGFETMDRIRELENGLDIPIVFLTADNDAATETKCLRKGAIDFIVKPVVADVMKSRIARILELEELRKSLAERLEQKVQEVTEIKSKSRQDPLTGLWNRAYTEECIDNMLRNGDHGAFFMIDMDNFKEINDNYGHLAGDHMLKVFADTLVDHAKGEDLVCRIGGDEFVLFVKNEPSKDMLRSLAADIIMDLCRKIATFEFEVKSSVSIGIAQAPDDGNDFKSLYTNADKALYHVKQNGKNSFHFYSEQREVENSRAGKLVDLNYLRDVMVRADSKKGSYLMNYDSFHHVYNFIRRCVERKSRDVQMVLFTLMIDNGYTADTTEIETAMEVLEQAVFTSLRRADVSTRYSSRQMVVILMDATQPNGELVAKRVISCFDSYYKQKHIHIDYGIVQMDEAKD